MKFWTVFFLLLGLARLPALTFEDGDTVVLLGNTVVERAQKYGHLETALTLACGKAGVRFRNLGWSGDTVYGDARSYFGPPQEGFDRLKDNLAELKPQIVMISYGAVASFEGEAGLDHFIKGYERLLEMISTTASPREIVLISPPPAESLGAPLPDMGAHNRDLILYKEAIATLAERRGLQFADLFQSLLSEPKGNTDNGIHFTEQGYRVLSQALLGELGLPRPAPGQLESESGQQLRQAIIAKNKLFFFQWRPSNETYLRLFRKHEQGQNARELAEFDPLIAAAEAKIESLRKSTLE